MKRLAAVILCLLLTAGQAYAEYEPSTGMHKACVAYQRADLTWSHGYKVRGFMIKGIELINFALQHGYKAEYDALSNYYVIPWDNGGYTSLDVSAMCSSPPMFKTEVKDQNGYSWTIRDGWDFCY